MRIGLGYDVHRLQTGRKLIIGGVDIAHEKGLLGHSDADVLVHAVIDALLGACGLGDIGRNFPDNDDEYKDIDSLILLKRTSEMMAQKNFKIINIDSTVVAQAPKLSPYIETMRKNIANALETDIENISIKAKTEEGLGFTGSCEGISAHAVCLVGKISG